MACDLILALDAPTPREVAPVLGRLAGSVHWVKIGMEMFTASGPDCVREVAAMGFSVFLDLKFHDIPNTVAGAVTSAARLPVGMLTVHTAGGLEMMRRAAQAAQTSTRPLRVLGVTVLTSLAESDLRATGVNDITETQVVRLARLAVEAGLGGLVCSPRELPTLRRQLPTAVSLVTPGIRPAGSSRDDQARVMTPREAAAAGANFIVVGRPILRAEDPVGAAQAVLAELGR